MKYQNIAELGDVIKAYDFMGRDDHIVGIVLEKGASSYTVKVIESVTESESFNKARYGRVLQVPFQSIVEYEGRVELLESFENSTSPWSVDSEVA